MGMVCSGCCCPDKSDTIQDDDQPNRALQDRQHSLPPNPSVSRAANNVPLSFVRDQPSNNLQKKFLPEPDKRKEERGGQPTPVNNLRVGNPIGLENIGNSCYMYLSTYLAILL